MGLSMTRTKYPRTCHLPWSLGKTDDDRVMSNVDSFIGKHVVVTEKYDGENTSLYADGFSHSRSVDSQSHESQSWLKQFWNVRAHNLPSNWRICGENLYAKHSIYYNNLPSYFLGFSLWNENNICLDWKETQRWFSELYIVPVSVLYDGIYNEREIKDCWHPRCSNTQEGYVVRLAESFSYEDFSRSVGKFVRSHHVRTDDHWKYGKEMERNVLKKYEN